MPRPFKSIRRADFVGRIEERSDAAPAWLSGGSDVMLQKALLTLLSPASALPLIAALDVVVSCRSCVAALLDPAYEIRPTTCNYAFRPQARNSQKCVYSHTQTLPSETRFRRSIAMTIEFRCIRCGQLLRVNEQDEGKRARCPTCNAIVDIPGGDQPTTPIVLSRDKSDVIDYELFGDEKQYVEITLDPGEITVAKAEHFLYMSARHRDGKCRRHR